MVTSSFWNLRTSTSTYSSLKTMIYQSTFFFFISSHLILMLLCSMISFSLLRAIHQVIFTFPSLYDPLHICINTNTVPQAHVFLSSKCSLSSKAWNEEGGKKRKFIKQHILAFCFRTGPKITVAVCGYQGFILTTELRYLNLCNLFWRPPAHTLTLFLLPTESPHLYHQLWAQNTPGSVFKHL